MDVGRVSIYEAAQNGDFMLLKWIVEYSKASLNEFADNHRTVLHYAAMSGNPEMFIYLVERCGLDPLQGDEDLVTPWDIVKRENDALKSHEKKEEDRCGALEAAKLSMDKSSGLVKIDNYLAEKYGHRYEDFYRNPIRTGFFPDPSICRVGDDYYMVNSSFIFFPCIPISHSKDLIHWDIIGHAITNPDWSYLDGLEGGRGYWAPDISYYEGKFYIAATYRLNDIGPVYRRQMIVCSDKPEGPYSEPVFIDEDGIDPGLFNDDDGRRYMLLNRGARIFELDKTGTQKISEPVLLYYGSNKRAPEGPHIYKKDGYYYLLQAEGGTGPGHRVTVSRSKELMGVYEPCPYNPIMRQNDEGATIQRCGHGDLVETPDGRWFMVYLCGRKIGDGYSILGRETALDPVTWTADGWPIVNNLKGPSCMQVKPYIEKAGEVKSGKWTVGDSINSDNAQISPCGIPFDYMTPRPLEKDALKYIRDIDECSETFIIRGSKMPLSSIDSRNIVLRRQCDFSFEYTVVMDIPNLTEGQTAGICGYYDENTYLEFGIIKKDNKILVYSNEHIGEIDSYIYSEEPLLAECSQIELKMTTDHLKRSLCYGIITDKDLNDSELTTFATLSKVYYLCDEGYDKGKRFTGALVGMYAYGGIDNELYVSFHNPTYEGKEMLCR
ncbi:family 43 glycosylhydrolase [Butyrivibrio sp. VCB2006]|uniref:family 43 glycosylhydrolase n=1 Tax=Butyrivibrio sp. VCB2006 TaxID=1280679 RepID=UPI0004210E19|nr:family 43 glycosylhydrolase [Butyrivibrio sp. VCB2006]